MSEETTKTKQLPVQGKDIDSIMENLETGVAVLFTSDRYQEYLRTMAKFHRYSFNNTLLIAMQRPDATLVTSYKNWQSMGRQVMKGEKGIMIIAPAPYKKMKEREILDQNQRPILGIDGKPKTELVEVMIPHFKAITVFDIGQTTGEPIQTLAPELLTAAVDHYDMFMEAIQKISPVPMRFDEISGNANGYFHTVDKEIVIQKGMSESQTLKTAIHETAHAKLHDKEIMEEMGVEKDRLTKEVEAESVAYCVCSAFQVDTSEYSFPYIAGWSSNREMKELKTSMDLIRRTAGEMIEQLTEELQMMIEAEQTKEFQKGKEKWLPAVKAAGYYLCEEDCRPGYLLFVPDGMHELAGSVATESWDQVGEWMKAVMDRKDDISERVERVLYPEHFEQSEEMMMFTGTDDRYAIYHIDAAGPGGSLLYKSMDHLQERGKEVNVANYQCVYSGKLMHGDTLDTLYAIFNDKPPADYNGHSLSVSDVVIMKQEGNLQAFYVDRFGFAEVPEFVTQRQEQLGMPVEAISQLNQNETTKETERASISFYAAECSEFPVLGEVHTDLSLDDAIKAYENIPSERMNGIKSVGFDLKDGSDYEGMNDLLVGGRSQREFLDSIQHFKESPLVQNALTHVEKYIEEKQRDVENSQKKEKQVGKSKRTTKKKDNGEKELNTEVKKSAPKKKKEDLSL